MLPCVVLCVYIGNHIRIRFRFISLEYDTKNRLDIALLHRIEADR